MLSDRRDAESDFRYLEICMKRGWEYGCGWLDSFRLLPGGGRVWMCLGGERLPQKLPEIMGFFLEATGKTRGMK